MKTVITKPGNVFQKNVLPGTTLLILAASVFLISSCSSGDYGKYASEEAKLADSVAAPISSSAAKYGKADSNHTFIRTADIKFKVKDVRSATFRIEDIIAKHGGFVTYTNLSSNISWVNKTQVTEDSTMEATHYQVDNSLTIRVPNMHLDSALREIAPLMNFLDHRTIKADDIKFTLMANQLAENRYKQHKQRFTEAIDNKGKKLRETASAEDELLVKQENADNTRIETLELLDKVEYSTVILYIYQPETIQYAMVVNEDNVVPYKPSFFKQLGDSFKSGWLVFEQIILFFVKGWGIILLLAAMFFGIKWLIGYLSKTDLNKA